MSAAPTPRDIVRALHRRLSPHDPGRMTENEAVALATVIRRRRPRRVLQVGVADGLSTLLLHHALAATPTPSDAPDGPRLIALDRTTHAQTDESRPTGWLLLTESGGRVPDGVGLRIGVTTADLATLPEIAEGPPLDLAVIDAEPEHPWPTLNALMIWPHLDEDAILMCRGLALFRASQSARGVGSKLLCDQIPTEARCHLAEDDDHLLGGTLFGVIKTPSDRLFAAHMADALLLPWTVRHPPDPALTAKIRDRLTAAFPTTPVAEAFTEGLRRTRGMRDGTL